MFIWSQSGLNCNLNDQNLQPTAAGKLARSLCPHTNYNTAGSSLDAIITQIAYCEGISPLTRYILSPQKPNKYIAAYAGEGEGGFWKPCSEKFLQELVVGYMRPQYAPVIHSWCIPTDSYPAWHATPNTFIASCLVVSGRNLESAASTCIAFIFHVIMLVIVHPISQLPQHC